MNESQPSYRDINPKEKTLVIGSGEIGKSLKNVFDPYYDVYIRDIEKPEWETPNDKFRVIHIAYPFFENFVETTKGYIRRYGASLCIIHSTVPVGTTRRIGSVAVHSPVNGRHPNLEQGINTFVKFVGGTDVFPIFEAVTFLKNAGIRPHVFSKPESTELAKIMCTTQLGWFVVLMKEIARLCDKYDVPFHEAYTEWNNAYNEGYASLGEMRFMRPNLMPMDGPIGGHCVLANCELLEDFLTETIKSRNKLYLSSRMVLEKGGEHHDRRKHKDMASRTQQHQRKLRNRG